MAEIGWMAEKNPRAALKIAEAALNSANDLYSVLWRRKESGEVTDECHPTGTVTKLQKLQ